MTRSFIRPLIAWQRATNSATAYPNPFVVLALADLDEAAVDVAAARAWVAAIETVERAGSAPGGL